MVALVTLDTVNFRLRLDLERDGAGEIVDSRKEDFEQLVGDATGIVLAYLKTDGSQWTLTPGVGEEAEEEEEGESAPTAVPASVTSAIILVVRNLYDEVEEPLSTAVKNLLHHLRDPALK